MQPVLRYIGATEAEAPPPRPISSNTTRLYASVLLLVNLATEGAVSGG